MVARWEKLRAELVADYRVLRVCGDRSRSPRTGAAHDFIVLEMADWVNVVPITAAGRVVMIRQYRHGTRNVGLEIPGGVAEGDDASLAQAAARELEEETGYVAADMIELGRIAPNPAIQDNYCHSFLALGAERTRAQDLDPGEDIAVEEVALEGVAALIQTGEIHHSLVVVAFYWLEQYRRVHPERFNFSSYK